jgi:hypothetical protein
MRNFEKLLKINKFVRDIKTYDKQWRLDAKSELGKMDRGDPSEIFSDFPESQTIISANRKNPQSVVNHLGFYPPDSVIEATRFKIAMLQAEEMAKLDKLEDAVEHVMLAHEAMAACNLHADMELVKQINMLGGDVIVLRGMNHVYLVNLDRYDIPVVDGSKVVNFSDMLARNGISIYPKVEETPLTFGERAINSIICSGGMDKDKHRELTLLEIFFANHMTTKEIWNTPGGIDQGLKAATAHFDEAFRRPAAIEIAAQA